MIKISRLADYAVVILVALSEEQEDLTSACALAQKTKLPDPTVSKVLKTLVKSDVVESVRGACGGYRLAREIKTISVADVIQAVDGPISLTSCIDGNLDVCGYAECCAIKGRWDGVNDALRSTLEQVTLADMMRGAI